MFVIPKDGKIEYDAATPDKVASEMQRFYNDLDLLVKADL